MSAFVKEGEGGTAASPETRGWNPSDRVHGRLRPPGSKSLAQRALLAATLLDVGSEELLMCGLPVGGDVDACLGVARSLGLRIDLVDSAAAESPRGGFDAPIGMPERGARITLRDRAATAATLDLGESGTLARCATALAALHFAPGAASGEDAMLLTATGTLLGRTSAPLVASLRRAGATLEPVAERGTWPLRVRRGGSSFPEELLLCNPVSSQEVSALWLACAGSDRPATVRVEGTIPSLPYLALTRDVLGAFGVGLEGDDHSLTLRGPARVPAGGFAVEADASSAAVALAAGCLSGGRVEIEGIGEASRQGDLSIAALLEQFGCRAGRSGGELYSQGRPTRGVEVDLADAPDLAPVLAAVAAGAAVFAGATSRLRGLGTLRGKESDRLAVLAGFLRALGLESRETEASLTISPGAIAPFEGAVLDPMGDHRMAFAIALFGLVRPGVRALDPACVSKSWPCFWETMAALGAGRS